MGNVISLNQDDLNNSEKMDDLNKAMDDYYDELDRQMKSLAQELGISEDIASNVFYLRTRSRWSLGLEKQFIADCIAGLNPNVFDYGCGVVDLLEYL